LAEDIHARENLPPFDRSGLDGYAVRSEDTIGTSTGNPVTLRVIGASYAGRPTEAVVEPGTAVRITTGAPVPLGADAVIREEDTREKDDWVSICEPLRPDDNIGRAGEDVESGTMVLTAGSLIRPSEIGLLAALGYDRVLVYARPRVAIICTGDELVEPGRPPGPGEIRNSNAYAISALVRDAGGVPFFLGAVSDNPDAISARINQARGYDLIVTTGGVSVGAHDYVKGVLETLGAEIIFWRVAIKPGTPAVAARWGKSLVIGLSGNPAAAMTSFDLLVRPVIAQMSGRPASGLAEVVAVLDNDYGKASGVRRYLRARIYRAADVANSVPGCPGVYRVDIHPSQRPGVMSSMIECNGFVIVPEGSGNLRAGDRVRVLLQGDPPI
jgi:molybdopterin molybdotransferase